MAKARTAKKAGTRTLITVVQVHSPIGRPERQRATLRSLGLRRIRQRRQLPDLPSVREMVKSIGHLVRIEEGPAAARKGTDK